MNATTTTILNTAIIRKQNFDLYYGMKTYMNCQEILQSSSVKTRSHLGATTEDVIDYVIPTAQKSSPKMFIHSDANEITNKVNTLCRKLES